MPVVSTMKLTARQFLAMDDPPGARLELVNGEVAVSPSPRPRHSISAGKLFRLLGNHVEENDLGCMLADVDTLFGPHDVRRPDLIFYRKDRVHLIDLDDALSATPDLCVEVVSPTSQTIDRVDKFEQYAAGGVAHYWILDPFRQTLEGYRLSRGVYELCGSGGATDIVRLAPFETLEIKLARLWGI